MPSALPDRRDLLEQLDTRLQAHGVETLLLRLGLDVDNVWPRQTIKRQGLINLIELYEHRDRYPDLAAAVEAFLAVYRPPDFPVHAERTADGQVIRYYNLPRRNPAFTGRADLLAALRAALTSGRPAALTQALHGLGGIGKTQLALEYAYRHLPDYDLVWWLRAEDSITLASDLAALATPLFLPERREPDQSVVVAAVLRWLEGHGRWLLVYDNAPDPATVKPYLPRAGAGHVVLTSRYTAWRGHADPLTVPVLPDPEAVAFLLARTGQTDADAALALARELGCLPLALEQAAAYIEERGQTLPGYLALFQTRHADLLQRGQPATDYPATVWTTWDLSFQQVRAANPAAADLLTLCAFFAPDDIPLSLIRDGAAHLPDPLQAVAQDPVALDDAIALLLRYSLVTRADDSLALHRLVQAVTRDHLPAADRAAWSVPAAALLATAFPAGNITHDPGAWPTCARLLPHALAAADHAEAAQAAPQSTTYLLNQSAGYLHARADYTAARVLHQRALVIRERVLGPDHPDTARSLNNLADVLHDQGDLPTARQMHQRALAINERVLGPDHPATATALNNLAAVLRAQGDLAAARQMHQRALAIRERVLGPDHPATATALDNLAEVLRAQGDLPAAGILHQRALHIFEKALGPDHPDTAASLNNLALVLHAQGEFGAARPLYERALAICEKALGPDHPTTANSLNNLAALLLAQGDLPAARAFFERALHIAEKSLGPDHPTTQLYGRNLAALGAAPRPSLWDRLFRRR